MTSYTKNYNYTDVDTAVSEYKTQMRSTRSRVRIKDMSPETAQVLLDYVDSPRIPHSVMTGSSNTVEITLLSDTLAPTLITVVGSPVIWKMRENLIKRISQVI